jgi:hypothetical protein
MPIETEWEWGMVSLMTLIPLFKTDLVIMN